LDGVFGELGFSGFLFRPYYGEGGIKLGVPVVRLGDDNAGTFSLHDHGIDKVLEGFLGGNKFFHDDFVDLVYPVGNFPLLVLFGTESSINGLVDDLLEFLRRELNLLELFGHFLGFTLFELIY
jgi:hypothetical protein